MLNKPTEEINKEKINEDDGDNNNIYQGRFNIDDLDDDDDEENEKNEDLL